MTYALLSFTFGAFERATQATGQYAAQMHLSIRLAFGSNDLVASIRRDTAIGCAFVSSLGALISSFPFTHGITAFRLIKCIPFDLRNLMFRCNGEKHQKEKGKCSKIDEETAIMEFTYEIDVGRLHYRHMANHLTDGWLLAGRARRMWIYIFLANWAVSSTHRNQSKNFF